MKKNILIATVIIIVFLSNLFCFSVVHGEGFGELPNGIREVKCSVLNQQVTISISIDAYKGYKVMRFDGPDRIVIDIPNATGPLIMEKINVGHDLVKAVRYAKNNATTARVVIETNGKPQYSISEKEGALVFNLGKVASTGLFYSLDNNTAKVSIPGIRLTQKNSKNKKQYTQRYDFGGKQYTITFPSSLSKLETKTIKPNDALIKTIQITNNKKTKLTTVVISAKAKLTSKMRANTEFNITEIIMQKAGTINRGDEERPRINELTKVEYLPTEKGEIVDLYVENYQNYNVSRVTEANLLVIDIPNVKAPTEEKMQVINGPLVKNIRYVQGGNNGAKIVIEMTGQKQYFIQEKTGKLRFNIEEPSFKNITYHNKGDRVYFLLNKGKLTEGAENVTKLYKETYDSSGKQYTITFSNKLADIGSGEIKINDNLLDSIQIIQNENEPTTSIVFNAKDSFIYHIITREVTNDAAITILKPFTKEDKVVIIDPGHGGAEPGAVFGDILEKHLDLDIAQRLNLLLKSQNIKTFMIREDDTYVGLYERCYIANHLNGALFLSIHNNAFNSSEYGTETLYTPKDTNEAGFTGKRFAQLIQNSLVGKLGTFDRKIKSRPGLVVLKATKMPAALAEIAFMTNTGDRANLLTEDFRQKTAEALFEAIVSALAEN